MISINNSAQGIYIAGEGLEQKIFQLGDNLLLFDGEVSSRLVRSVDAYKDDFDGLINRISTQYDSGSVIVCGAPRNKQQIYCAGKRQIVDVSAGYSSKDVVVKFSGTSLADFVDFVEHSQSTQFGFVLNGCASVLLCENVQISLPTQLYRDDNLNFFSKIVMSYFNAFVNEHPQELKVYLQNLCYLDVGEICNSISSSNTKKSTAYDAVVFKLLNGTSYYLEHKELLNSCHKTFALQKNAQELYVKNIEKLNVLVREKDKACDLRDSIIDKMYCIIQKINHVYGIDQLVGQGSIAYLQDLVNCVSKQQAKRHQTALR